MLACLKGFNSQRVKKIRMSNGTAHVTMAAWTCRQAAVTVSKPFASWSPSSWWVTGQTKLLLYFYEDFFFFNVYFMFISFWPTSHLHWPFASIDIILQKRLRLLPRKKINITYLETSFSVWNAFCRFHFTAFEPFCIFPSSSDYNRCTYVVYCCTYIHSDIYLYTISLLTCCALYMIFNYCFCTSGNRQS